MVVQVLKQHIRKTKYQVYELHIDNTKHQRVHNQQKFGNHWSRELTPVLEIVENQDSKYLNMVAF